MSSRVRSRHRVLAPCGQVLVALIAFVAGPSLLAAAELTVCTQNLWNYGLAEDVQRLRRPGTSLQKVRSDLERQERALALRLAACDVIAVEEVVGDRDDRAKAALDRLARLLRERTGRVYEARIADTRDVIRNGFLVRTGGDWSVAGFEGRHSKDPLPALSRYPRVAWDRGPAEIVLEAKAARASTSGEARDRDPRAGTPTGTGSSDSQASRRTSGAASATGSGAASATGSGAASATGSGAASATGPGAHARAVPLRVRVIAAHLKSKRETRESPDRAGERWERLRVVQAEALRELARRRLADDPDELVLVVGDFNNGRGSATREILAGSLDPAALLSPNDCIDSEGRVACPLPRRPPLLIDLADVDPDLRGRGTYRYRGREELIDGIFASSRAAELAREPHGEGADDYDVALVGRVFEGSDHRMLKVTLRERVARRSPRPITKPSSG